MDLEYQKVIDYMVACGKRLVQKSSEIEDLEARRDFFRQEDVLIERGLKKLIQSFGNNHVLYSEEENNVFQHSHHVWIADPISGTQSFLNGLPHYCNVVSHVMNGKTVFACIYDPSVDELFTAILGKGSFLNGRPIHVSNSNNNIIFRGVVHFPDRALVEMILEKLTAYSMERSFYSYSYNYCSVACGRIDGVISLTKDSFPEFAGSLLIREAGGMVSNQNWEVQFSHDDRIFVAGNDTTYKKLLSIVKSSLSVQ